MLEDYHLLGKRIVYSVLRASGFELLNYGRMDLDTLIKLRAAGSSQNFIDFRLMLPSALRIKELAHQTEGNWTQLPKIVVGGAPFRFDTQLWREVGADAVGTTAVEAVEIVHRLIEEMA